MINRKIAMSAVSIMTALALAGGATFAFFSDTGSSTGNIFSAGSLILQLDDENQEFSDSVSASIGGSDMAPGDSESGFISLHNEGSIDAAEVVLGATQTLNDNGEDGSDLADVLNLTVGTDTDNLCVDPTDLTGTIAAAIGNNSLPLTLKELVDEDYNALPGLGADYFLCLTATMQSTAGNEYQGDSKTVNFDFTANQNDTP